MFTHEMEVPNMMQPKCPPVADRITPLGLAALLLVGLLTATTAQAENVNTTQVPDNSIHLLPQAEAPTDGDALVPALSVDAELPIDLGEELAITDSPMSEATEYNGGEFDPMPVGTCPFWSAISCWNKNLGDSCGSGGKKCEISGYNGCVCR